MRNCRSHELVTGYDFRALIRHYRVHHRPHTVDELDFFANAPSLQLAIHHAALAIDHREKRFGHQCRIPFAVLARAKVVLESAVPRLKGCRSFDELHALLRQLLGRIRGLGELYFYDTALRLGAFLRHLPEFVYLHHGTRMGARILGLDTAAPYIAVDQLPAQIRELLPHEIEDFLCIYRDNFRQVKANRRIQADARKIGARGSL